MEAGGPIEIRTPGRSMSWEEIANGTDVAPYGATFEDGYRAAEICDAIVRSGERGERVTIEYRSL